jgi:hypothetical protein
MFVDCNHCMQLVANELPEDRSGSDMFIYSIE